MSETEHGASAPAAAPKAKTALVPVPKPTGPAPAHARDPRRDEATKRGTNVSVSREALFELLDEVKKLSPCHKDPHRYHERKDEIASLLFQMATAS